MTLRAVQLGPEARSLLAAAGALLAGREAYLVGGSLRDALLGRPITDIDLAVAGDAVSSGRALADRLGGHFALLDEERGVARVILREAEGAASEDAGARYVDIAPLLGGDVEADLGRRDFTVDALAAPLETLAGGGSVEVIDPFGGLGDLAQRTIRLVSEQALVEDPLRLLRAVRLAVQLEFEIAPETAAAVRARTAHIGEAAAERQRDELVRCFRTPRAATALRLMDELGLLERLLPEVAAGRGVAQPKEHFYDVFDHAIETVAALDFMLAGEERTASREGALWRALWDTLGARHQETVAQMRRHLAEQPSEGRSRAVLLKTAGLLHDVAKPETRAPDATGRIRFLGHAERGAETARRVLRRLRFSRRETDLVATMVEEHLRPMQLGQPGEPPTRRALFRFFRDTGEAAESILLLSLADALAARGPRMTLEAWRGHVAYIAHVLARRHEDETIFPPRRLLTGDDIIDELGLKPGPNIGRLLALLEDAVGSGEVTTRDEALAFVRQLVEMPQPLAAGAR